MLEIADRSPSLVPSHPGAADRRERAQRRALVTGGSGFLGQHLITALLARGYAVRSLDTTAPARLQHGVEFVPGSVLDHAAVMAALEDVTHVFHLAAIPHLWSADRADFERVNRLGTEVMLAAACEMQVVRFLHCSTEAVLLPPRACGGVIDEDISLDLADMPGPYTRSKYLAEQAALAAAANGLDVVIVNPTVPIGGGDRNLTPPTAMLVQYLGRNPFYVDCVLNLVDVRDVATGMVLAAERGRSGERYILGGENVTLEQLLRRLQRVSGGGNLRINVPRPLAYIAGVVSDWIATYMTGKPPVATPEGVSLAFRSARFDCGKARRELGYVARPVQDALVEAVRWLRTSNASRQTAPVRASAPVKVRVAHDTRT